MQDTSSGSFERQNNKIIVSLRMIICNIAQFDLQWFLFGDKYRRIKRKYNWRVFPPSFNGFICQILKINLNNNKNWKTKRITVKKYINKCNLSIKMSIFDQCVRAICNSVMRKTSCKTWQVQLKSFFFLLKVFTWQQQSVHTYVASGLFTRQLSTPFK